MDKQNNEHRDRLIALGFVSLLLIVVYGPAAGWFVAADRFVYDQIAGRVAPPALADGVIISIDPANRSAASISNDYGRVLTALRSAGARRIVLPAPPPVAQDEALPDWAELLRGGPPTFVPTRHALAARATRTGYQDLRADPDGVLRRSNLWYLSDGVMSPSLPLAVALAESANLPAASVARNDAAIFVGGYAPLPRLAAAELLTGGANVADLAGKTVFLDAAPPLESAVALLPSGQYVTLSELTATMLGSIESGTAITAPPWAGVMTILVPAVLAVLAVLLLPGRSRREIGAATGIVIVALLGLEVLLLVGVNMRFDLGRPIVILAGAAVVTAVLAGLSRKSTHDAFKRGTDFLSAGRLEPAFAEFRRCKPTESLANAMYKLSLAFEEQAKPERAEAVLDWIKSTQAPGQPKARSPESTGNGTPRQLGRYVIEKKLGRGAMGAVYLARDPRINRAVALKVIPIEKEFEDEELKEARERFFREAESAGRLTHPNIITVYDCGEDKHLAYIAMEYLEGTSLIYFKDPKKLLAPRKALELCARTADALDYAHNQGVIHRDIKPANLLYNARNDQLKISDFGVARLTDNNRTKTGIVLGTPMYMSPEQLAAETLTGHSDLFSLGVTLYELLTGEVPFKATNIALLMKKITSEDPAPVSNRRPGVPPSVDTVLFKALAKRPEARFASGAEMAMALRNCAKYAST
ncbi:MAG: protein kinase [Woeseiaceae bacterium]|nr:protein kinase [Woeseiaceae bacterium]